LNLIPFSYGIGAMISEYESVDYILGNEKIRQENKRERKKVLYIGIRFTVCDII